MPPQQEAQNKYLAFLAWKKMNNKVARQNLTDEECWWAENLQPIGPNFWAVVNAPAPPLTVGLPANAVRIWPATFIGTDYLIVWAQDQSLFAVNTSTGVITFIITGLTDPDITVWASERILGVDPSVGYFTWDGSTLAYAGTVSPNIDVTAGGSGYTTAPTVTISGGSGSGATATAQVAAGQVVGVTLTNAGIGYQVGDVLTVSFGGPGTGATANARIFPQGIFGNRLDVFSGRVWIANQRNLAWTGTGGTTGGVGYDDFDPADAAGALDILDADLSHVITGVRNLNNYLYIFGDSSVRQIGSITLDSSGNITLFTPLTLASDIGTTFFKTIQSYNRLVLFANVAGVYGIFGASVKKISDDIDGIFQLVDFSLPLSAGVIDVHVTVENGGSLHCYGLLVRYLDPLSTTRTLILMYQDNQWWIANQGQALLCVSSIFLQASNHFELFASSGVDLTSVLQVPGVVMEVLFKSALSFAKAPLISKRLIRAGAAVTSAAAETFQFTVETEQSRDMRTLTSVALVVWVNNSGGIVTWVNNTSDPVSFSGSGYRWPYSEYGGEGRVIGATLSGNLKIFSLNAMAFEFVDTAIWGTIP